MTTDPSEPPNAGRRRWLAITIRAVAIAAIAGGLWWFIHEMDFAKLGNALGTATLWPLVLAATLNFACLWGKSASWHIMLAPRHRVPVRRLFRYTIAAFATSAITPARAGELVRVWTLKRREGVPVADTAAVAFAEKLLDGISMLLLVAPVPWLLPGLPPWVAGAIGLCGAIAVVTFAVLFIAVGRVGRVDPATSPGVIRRFVSGLHVLRSPSRLLAASAVLVGVWAADVGQVMSVLHAVDIELSVAAGLLILFTLNLTIVVPSTPAQVGALQVGALVALELLGVERERALAFALLYHAAQVVPLVTAGLLFELRLMFGRDAVPPAVPPPAAPAPG